MRFVTAFIQFTSNAAAVKKRTEDVGVFRAQKMDKNRAKMESEGDSERDVLHNVLVRNKFQNYSLTEQQVDLVLCARIAGKGESPSDTVSK
jgi:hypothetical protein